jgi:flagellar protein FliS
MNTVRKYQELSVTTASPMQLIIMLYDECIRALDKAESGFAIGDDPSLRNETIGNNILHAQDVITELAVSLDMEKGGEIAINLQRLYDFMVNHLARANVSKDIQSLREVRTMMADLRETWQEIAKKENLSDASPAPVQKTGTINVQG